MIATMCGIFGLISENNINTEDLNKITILSEQRGSDSSGLIWFEGDNYFGKKADFKISKLLTETTLSKTRFVMGHSRLITNGLLDNQPVIRGQVSVLHNGIIVNHDELWSSIKENRKYKIDTEIIAALTNDLLEKGLTVSEIAKRILNILKGVANCAILIKNLGKLILLSNSGSLYLGSKGSTKFFASEEYTLKSINCKNIVQVRDPVIIDVPSSNNDYEINEINVRKHNLIPELVLQSSDEALLQYEIPDLKRCTKCILPETMPFISFNNDGVCNYCENYSIRNNPKPKEELFRLVEDYRKENNTSDCIIPFSGGRDSCYGLHLVVNELKMNPITYTYDWGMVTDLGRRNISRMCAELGVENIIVAADIEKKRENIKKNLSAWLKSPHLGMISILTAGDKHFFKYVEQVKKQTDINLNLWGINPLEVTHFKAGFLGVPPDFEENHVYSNGALKQLRYQFLRLKAMSQSLGYFNSSIFDTLSGEYYRSFTKKLDYFHIFDYWKWDEKIIDDTLDTYDWERAPDTKTTWRIGDGTAAFYNYVYYYVSGLTEHDTFRSNQIREGDITREEAIDLIHEENRPRYANIKWYLDVLGFDFKDTINIVNKIPKIY